LGYDTSYEGDFFAMSSTVFSLKLPGKIRMRREVAKATRSIRSGPVSIALELRRPLDSDDFYRSVPEMTKEDYEHITRALNKWFAPKGMVIEKLKLKLIKKVRSSSLDVGYDDLVTAEFTVRKK
jgi:hypothetical protein